MAKFLSFIGFIYFNCNPFDMIFFLWIIPCSHLSFQTPFRQVLTLPTSAAQETHSERVTTPIRHSHQGTWHEWVPEPWANRLRLEPHRAQILITFPRGQRIGKVGFQLLPGPAPRQGSVNERTYSCILHPSNCHHEPQCLRHGKPKTTFSEASPGLSPLSGWDVSFAVRLEEQQSSC